MKKSALLIILVAIWLIFVIWEIEVTKWLKEEGKQVFRIDLVILLPGFILLTFYALKNSFYKK